MMAAFQGDSTDDEIGVNLQLAERLRINRGDHISSNVRTLSKKDQKQLCNQRKKTFYRDEQSSSSSSLEMPNDPSSSRLPSAYGLHNKKRQNGDKNIEQLANPKRTCLSDRFGGSPERKDHKNKTSYKVTIPNFSSQPLNLSKRNIFPDKTYEDHLNTFSDGDDSDFEPWKTITRKKKADGSETSRILPQGTSNLAVHPIQENQASSRHGVQFIDSTSDDDSRTVRQNGALKGGRQSPDPMSFKKVLGRKVRKVIESDDTDDDWQVSYRNHCLVFSSSDSDDSGPSNKVNKKHVDSTLKKAANLSFPSGDSFNSNHDHRYHKPDESFTEPYRVDSPTFHIPTEPTTSHHRGKNSGNKVHKTSSSNRTNGESFINVAFQNFDSYLPQARGEGSSLPRNSGLPPFRNVPSHQFPDSTSPKGKTFVTAHLRQENQPFHNTRLSRFAVHYPSDNSSPVPSYSGFCPVQNNTCTLPGMDAPVKGDESSLRARGATIPKMNRHHRTRSSKSAKSRIGTDGRSSKGKSNLAARYPDLFDAEDSSEVEFFTANSYSDTESNTESLNSLRRVNGRRNPPAHIQEIHSDSINVGSSEDEIRVVFTSVPQPPRNNEQRRGTPRTLGRRYNRGSRRHIPNTQDVVSLSPDPVEQVRQMEEDERFARLLQAQFDAETDPTYTPRVRRSPDPCRMAMREPSSSDEDSMDMEVFPRNSADGFLAIGHPFSIIPTVVSRRGSFRTRRPDPRNRRRWAGEEAWNLSRIFHSGPLTNIFSFESSDDSYEAFLGIAELNGDVTRGLQKAEINRLPTRKYTIPTGASSSNGAELPHKRAELNKECQVCLSDYVNGDVLRILPCFHEFHTPCIDPWLKINHTCPVCRVIVDLGEFE